MAASPRELRVVAGPQAGAGLALEAGATIDIGSLSSRGCQVVLRDPRVSEQRLRLRVERQVVHVDLLVGSAQLGGEVVFAPSTFAWPHFVAMRVGDTVMSIGEADSPRWAEVAPAGPAVRDSRSSRPPIDAASIPTLTDVEDELSAPPTSTQPRPHPIAVPAGRRRPEAWLALAGVAIAGTAFAGTALVSIMGPRAPAETELQRLQRVVQAPAFRGLQVQRDAQDHWVLRGVLLTAADQARLDEQLAQLHLQARIDAVVGEQVANAVRDVYRMNGVMAQTEAPTRLQDVGTVHLQTRSADLALLGRLESTARQDVAGLKNLVAENTRPDLPPEVTPVVNDPGKRVASIVPGDNAYVVTADGTRYFVGALLPSGHRLASIGDHEVLLEKDGKTAPLNF